MNVKELSALSLEIDFQENDDYVIADISGTFTKMSALLVFEKLMVYSSATHHNKILLDCRGTGGEVMTSDVYAFSKKTKEIQEQYNLEGRIHEMKNAYLFDEEKWDLDQFEEAVFDKEKDDFIISKDLDEALDWLGIDLPNT